MTNEELKTKTVNVSESQLNLLLDNNAYLRTILDSLMKDLNLDESEIAKKFD